MISLQERFLIETLAVSLYESDCREKAQEMGRRTTLSRIRAYYSLPSYTSLAPRLRNQWRARATGLIAESINADDEDDLWHGHAPGDTG